MRCSNPGARRISEPLQAADLRPDAPRTLRFRLVRPRGRPERDVQAVPAVDRHDAQGQVGQLLLAEEPSLGLIGRFRDVPVLQVGHGLRPRERGALPVRVVRRLGPGVEPVELLLAFALRAQVLTSACRCSKRSRREELERAGRTLLRSAGAASKFPDRREKSSLLSERSRGRARPRGARARGSRRSRPRPGRPTRGRSS